MTNYATKLDALEAASTYARDCGGFCFLIQWPAGHWTLSLQKPFTRTNDMQVIEYRQDQGCFLA